MNKHITTTLLREKILGMTEGERLGYRDLSLFSANLSDGLPREVLMLANLIRVELSYSNLKELPEWIGELRQLRQIRVSSCQLRFLPFSLGSLQLDKLYISGNQIEAVPKTLLCLRGVLRSLEGGGNPISVEPMPTSNMGPDTLYLVDKVSTWLEQRVERHGIDQWTPKNHHFFPREFRIVVVALLILQRRPSDDNLFAQIPQKDIIYFILSHLSVLFIDDIMTASRPRNLDSSWWSELNCGKPKVVRLDGSRLDK